MSISNTNPSIPTLHQSRSLLHGPVAILWDFANCPVPSDVRPEDVAGNIRMALRVHPVIDGAVTVFSAYGDFNAFPRLLREGCQRTGVKLVDVPNGRKDAADKAILVDLFLFALDNPPPSSIMLISGDVDFAPALHILGQRGYTIILVIPSGVGVSSALSNAGRFVWDWPNVARGEGFGPAAKALKPPCAGPVETAGLLMGCQVNDGVEGQNEEESIAYKGISKICYNTREVSMVSQSPSKYNSSSILEPQNPTSSRSRSPPSGINKVSTGTCASRGHNDLMSVKPGRLNGLKCQLVKVLKVLGGSSPLTRLPEVYQTMYGQPLCVSEYGADKLVNLLEKMVDAIAITRKGQSTTVFLRKSRPGPVGPQVDQYSYREPEQSKEQEQEEVTALPDYVDYTSAAIGVDWSSGQILDAQWAPDMAGAIPLVAGGWTANSGPVETAGLLMGCQVNDGVEGQNEEESIAYKGVSKSCYNTREVSMVSQSPSEYISSSILEPQNPTSRSRSPPSGINEVSTGTCASREHNGLMSVKPGRLNGLKCQLVKVLKVLGGSSPLTRLPEVYQTMYGRPLCVSEYGADKLVNLLEKMVDAIAITRKGQSTTVFLRKSRPGPVGPQVVDLYSYRESEESKEQEQEEVPALPDYADYTTAASADWFSAQIPDAQWAPDICGPVPLVAGGRTADEVPAETAGLLMGCQVNDGVEGQNEEESIAYKGISKSCYNTREVSMVSQSPSKYNNSSILEPQNPTSSRSRSPPSGINEVSTGTCASREHNDLMSVKPGHLNGLKCQLVKVLKVLGGSSPLTRLPEVYQKMYGRPLRVSEYGADKLVNLLEMMVDAFTIKRKRERTTVCLRKSRRGPVGPQVVDLYSYREPEESKVQEQEEVPALPDYADYTSAAIGADWFSAQIPDAQWAPDRAVAVPPMAAGWTADSGADGWETTSDDGCFKAAAPPTGWE